jgi:uncharacterized protein (DUF1697 family)
MKTFVALLRGINVVGSHMLAMKDLKALVERHECCDVRTYIQSGNVVFRSATADVDRLGGNIAAGISKSHGFEPGVIVLTEAELANAIAGNPFPEAIEAPKSVHLFFLAERPRRPDLKGCEALKTKTESFVLKGKVFYLHTPDGFGTSKLARRAEKLLGVPATARNWRTVTTLIEMMRST